MKHRIEDISSLPVQIVWHENKTTYLSVRKARGILHMRVHKLFYNAPTPVLQALVRYATKGDPKSRVIIKQMAHLHFSQTQIKGERLTSEGNVYDLKEIYSRLLKWVPISNCTIGWSDRPHTGKFRSLTFGTYDKHCRQIRINRLLDDEKVPFYFVEFVVYHEMLHALFPSVIDAEGRCSIHPPEFKEKERQFPYFRQAKEWEKTSLKFFKKRKSHGRS